MSTPTLDPPDRDLNAIRLKLFEGAPLTARDRRRWLERMAVEEETRRSGGEVQGSIAPPATATPSAYDLGRAETAQAADYLRGRAEVLRSAQPAGAASGRAPAPMNPFTQRPGASSLERARADGMAIGNDGQPFDPHGAGPRYEPRDFQLDANPTPAARRPQPTAAERAAGMSVSYDPQEGIPDGHGYAQFPDGSFVGFTPNTSDRNPAGFVLNPDGTRRRFKSLDEVKQHFASLSSAPQTGAAPLAKTTPADPVSRPAASPTPPAAPAAPAAPANPFTSVNMGPGGAFSGVLAPAARALGRMLTRGRPLHFGGSSEAGTLPTPAEVQASPGTSKPTAPLYDPTPITLAPELDAPFPAGYSSATIGTSLDAGLPPAQVAGLVNTTPNPAYFYSGPDANVPAHMQGPASVTDAARRIWGGARRAISRPVFQPKSRVYQAAADRLNPFSHVLPD